ncbi:hypothetical protein [Lacrimispora sp.]|jgi:hypothetical protein|uniref:hypothetical protein n=1 Tax=Lacrimispora sp. TaxID=2719234 RepID=UPI000451AE12|nr:hypothetical protein [Lacrimispora sp.]EXG86292.1 hypothetical protein K413DRAFT_3118 [Clostridium sp. ASBs410]MDR7813793.1 hypothetical protein [Lacrimispora sp.]
MNNEQNIRANDLDSLIGDNHLQMMKAALPYMSVSQQRFMSYFVKINELRRTINLFEEGEVAAMGLNSSRERERNNNPLDMLNTIKSFANPAEQDLIDLIINFSQGLRLANSSPDPSPIPSSTIPVQAQSQSQFQSQSQTEGSSRPTGNHRQNNNPFGRMPLDQLKNFMPPDQQAKFETMQLMMSAMQQMN